MNMFMIVVNISFVKVEISKYSRDELVLKIHFNDGKPRFIEIKTEIPNVEEFVEWTINEVRKKEKEWNRQPGQGVLDDVVMVHFSMDEEELYDRLFTVFSRVKEEVRKVRGARVATNYLQTVTNIHGAEFKF